MSHGRGNSAGDSPKRNLGTNEAILYLLVETKLLQNSALASVLLSVMTRSPVSTVSFFHGHFHRGRFRFGVALDGLGSADDDGADRWCSSSSSNVHPCGAPSPRLSFDCPAPAGVAPRPANGSPLSVDCIAIGRPNAESGSSSSSKNGSSSCGFSDPVFMLAVYGDDDDDGGYPLWAGWYSLVAGFACETSRRKSSLIAERE